MDKKELFELLAKHRADDASNIDNVFGAAYQASIINHIK